MCSIINEARKWTNKIKIKWMKCDCVLRVLKKFWQFFFPCTIQTIFNFQFNQKITKQKIYDSWNLIIYCVFFIIINENFHDNYPHFISFSQFLMIPFVTRYITIDVHINTYSTHKFYHIVAALFLFPNCLSLLTFGFNISFSIFTMLCVRQQKYIENVIK